MTPTTLEDFQRFAGRAVVQAALRRARLSEEGTYPEFVEQLYDDIDESIYAIQASRELRQADTEDRITQDILIGLSRQGYQATHDGKTGGHVDLSVRLGGHSWIAEAKKDGTYYEGLLQLTTRYVQASGNFAHDHGGLLLYMVTTADAQGALTRWRDKVTEGGVTCAECPKNRLAFFSTHKLAGSGTDFVVRTMVVSLFHRPLDRSARDSGTGTEATERGPG